MLNPSPSNFPSSNLFWQSQELNRKVYYREVPDLSRADLLLLYAEASKVSSSCKSTLENAQAPDNEQGKISQESWLHRIKVKIQVAADFLDILQWEREYRQKKLDAEANKFGKHYADSLLKKWDNYRKVHKLNQRRSGCFLFEVRQELGDELYEELLSRAERRMEMMLWYDQMAKIRRKAEEVDIASDAANV